ncbi:MAG: cytochrome C oxidase subunit II [Acidobacteriaceae bacterium]|nr:cytochrome C oxidase subunit II [Acidobacteriaceae bacterium]
MVNQAWLPAEISDHALAFDRQFGWTLATALTVLIAAQAGLVVVVWRFRRRSRGVAAASQGSGRLEAMWTIATAVVFLGLLALGSSTWAGVQFTPAPAGAEPIEVLGKQFAWNFRYPGNDGKFGKVDPLLMNDAGGNPFGIDERDSAGKDDIVSATLRIPAGRPVLLTLNSVDVIHSFFVRELRLKQDLVPGMRIPIHFVAKIPGTYEIPCAELCGLGHFQMRSAMIVLPAAEFDAWKRGQTR